MTAPRSIPAIRAQSNGCNYPDCTSPTSPSIDSLRSGSFDSLLSPLRYMSTFPSRVFSDFSAPQSRRGSVSDALSPTLSPTSPGAVDSRALASLLQQSSYSASNPVDRHKGMPSVEAFLGD